MDDLDTLVRQAETDVQDQEALVASADARVAVAQADAEEARSGLSEARIVLEWLRRRGQPQPDAAPPPDRTDQPKPRLLFGRPMPEGDSKLKKCLDALEDLGGTASNKQISGRVDMDPDHVRGLLKYASGKKPNPPVVTEPGSGVWRL